MSLLSASDQAILDMIFCPGKKKDSFNLYKDKELVLPSVLEQEFTVCQELIDIEKHGIELASTLQGLPSALVWFDEAIAKWPDYASFYNNRAQVERLMGDLQGALKDLDQAINKVFDNENDNFILLLLINFRKQHPKKCWVKLLLSEP